jgi:hypothetical protein
MDYHTLQYRFRDSPTIRILRSDHAPLILSFFYNQFKSKGTFTIPYGVMRESLAAYMEHLETAGIQDAFLEMTPESERALTWVQELEKREFVGTESRFLRIFELLRDINRFSNTDIEQRLADLRSRRRDIDREIASIKRSGIVSTFNDTQVKERFYEMNDTAYRLLADFREVEQNFKAFVRDIQRRRMRDDISKGDLLRFVLDTDSEIKDSDQGRSFYAFYQFLSSPGRQDELDRLVRDVLSLPEVSRLPKNDRLLRGLKHRLIEAGEKIIGGNNMLSEQMRRFLDEKVLTENRRSARLLSEIKRLAFATAQTPPASRNFSHLELWPELCSAMERTPWDGSHERSYGDTPTEQDDQLVSSAELADLFSTAAVDRQRLTSHLEQSLSEHAEISLAQLIETFPLQDGLAELIVYLHIAGEHPHHSITEDKRENIRYQLSTTPDDASWRTINLPLTIFRRVSFTLAPDTLPETL